MAYSVKTDSRVRQRVQACFGDDLGSCLVGIPEEIVIEKKASNATDIELQPVLTSDQGVTKEFTLPPVRMISWNSLPDDIVDEVSLKSSFYNSDDDDDDDEPKSGFVRLS